ncbi:MAG TPA: TRAM domain-containing protein, partial [Thermodesulfobacteriota bacterium]|nr:TRAM domain-containing protein [Thermodesulfobacteriota bacterium]
MTRRVRLSVEGVAFKGYGVARVDGKVVFVPYALTGDEAWGEIAEEKKTYSTARLIQMINPSPGRVTPPCPYFGSCGGCQWQHIDDSIQAELKKEILEEILKRLGALKEIPAILVVPSAKPYDYRARVQLKVRGGVLGYHQERSHRIVDVERCAISHSLINQIIRHLRDRRDALSPLEEVEINVSPEEGRGVLLLHPRSYDRRLDRFAEEFLESQSMVQGFAIAQKEGYQLFGDPTLSFTLPSTGQREEGELRFRISPGSFFQVNPEQNQRLVRTVL